MSENFNSKIVDNPGEGLALSFKSNSLIKVLDSLLDLLRKLLEGNKANGCVIHFFDNFFFNVRDNLSFWPEISTLELHSVSLFYGECVLVLLSFLGIVVKNVIDVVLKLKLSTGLIVRRGIRHRAFSPYLFSYHIINVVKCFFIRLHLIFMDMFWLDLRENIAHLDKLHFILIIVINIFHHLVQKQILDLSLGGNLFDFQLPHDLVILPLEGVFEESFVRVLQTLTRKNFEEGVEGLLECLVIGKIGILLDLADGLSLLFFNSVHHSINDLVGHLELLGILWESVVVPLVGSPELILFLFLSL